MVGPGFKECPYCYEEIREKARLCRFCHAVLVNEKLEVVFVDSPNEGDIESVVPDEFLVPTLEYAFNSRGVALSEQNWNRIRRILDSPPEGYRMATVLFVDLCGYTGISSLISAEEMKTYLDAFYDHCVHSISLHNGFVVKFIGDGVIAVFGAPVAYDRDVESAMRAALDIRKQVSSLPSVKGHRLSVTIGIHTGEILSSVVTSRDKGPSFDIFGSAVNLACRLESVAKDGEILVSQDTFDMCSNLFNFRRHRSVKLKGIAKPVKCHEVIDVKQTGIIRRDFDIPLVGRNREIDEVRKFLERDGQAGSILAISGQPGVGKSRLVAEAVHACANRVEILECSPEVSRVPYHVFRRLVEKWLRLRPGLSSTQAIGEFRLRYRHFSDEDILYLQALLGEPAAFSSLGQVSPNVFKDSLRNILRRFLATFSENEEIVLCVDDLQWADSASLDLLSDLFESSPIRCARLIVVYRLGFKPSWRQPESLKELVVADLPIEARQSLLTYFLANRELVPEVKSAILNRSNGNPLYIEQIAKTFLHEYDQIPEEERDSKVSSLVSILPGSLKEIIQSRIDLLENQTRQVLQCSAVLGMNFTFDLIRIYEFIRDNLLDELYTLEGLEFLSSHRNIDEVRFAFRHPLTQEVAYQSLLQKRRHELHLIIAKRLESSFSEQIYDFYNIIAFHYGRTDDHEKAVYYYQKAAERSRSFCAYRDALELYEDALDRLQGLTPTEERQVQVARLLTDRARLQRLIGELPDSFQSLEACLKIVENTKNDVVGGHYLYELGLNYQHTGQYGKARDCLYEALEIGCKSEKWVRVKQLGHPRSRRSDWSEEGIEGRGWR